MGKDKGEELGRKADKMADKAEEKKNEAADTTLGQIGHSIKEGAQKAYDKTAETAQKAKDKLTSKD